MSTGISVIIPVYNAEKYIKDCILSLSIQTFDDLECIFVIDKNTTDNSEEIIKSVSNRLNLKIIKPTESCGAGYNRNVGIERATKEYIGFVDADDCISKEFYEKLYSDAKKHDSDIVMGETVVLDKNHKVSDYYKIPTCTETNLGKIYSMMEYSTVWDKIYRSKIVKPDKTVRFPEGVIHEDNFFTLAVLAKTNKLTTTPGAIYYWIRNPESVTQLAQQSEKCIDDAYVVFDNVLNFLYKLDISTDDKLKIIKHNIDNYAIDAIFSLEYKSYIMEKLKLLLGKQAAYKIYYEAEQKFSDL